MPTKNGIYTSGASPSKDDGYEWMGGTALAMVLKKENAIVVAADRQLIRKRKRDQSTYEDGGYETIPFQAELQYIHQLDNNTGCVVVGQRPIANSWFGYLDAKLSSKGGSSNMYKSKNKVNAESNNTLLASLQHLSDFQKDHFNAKETASEVLLVGWNEQAELNLKSWNLRGLSHVDRRGEFKTLLRFWKSDVVCSQGTKIRRWNRRKVMNMGFKCRLHLVSVYKILIYRSKTKTERPFFF